MFKHHVNPSEATSSGMRTSRGVFRTLVIVMMTAFSLLVAPYSAQATPTSTDACPTAGVKVPYSIAYIRGSSSPYSAPSVAQGAIDVSGTSPFCGGAATTWQTVAELGSPRTSYVGYVSFPPLPSGATYFDSSGNINFTLTGTPGALGYSLYFLDRTVIPNVVTNPSRVGNVSFKYAPTNAGGSLFQWTTDGQPASGEYTVTGTVSGISSTSNIDTNGFIVEITGLGATSGVSAGASDDIKTLTVKRYGTIVTFDANGGNGADRLQAGTTSAPLSANTFSRAGFTFSGWATSPTGSVVYSDGASFDFSGSSQTLFAQWAALPAVTFTANGGTGADVVQYGSGSAALTTGTFNRSGFTFSGWNTAPDGTGTPYLDQANFNFANGNVTLHAQWTAVASPSQNQSSGSGSGSTPAPAPSRSTSQALASTGVNTSNLGLIGLVGGSLIAAGLLSLIVRRGGRKSR